MGKSKVAMNEQEYKARRHVLPFLKIRNFYKGHVMTASKQAKEAGLKNLSQVRDMLGTNKSGHPMVNIQTLNNWHNNKQELFEVVLLGCVAKLDRDSNN